jgi:hypothetical protein
VDDEGRDIGVSWGDWDGDLDVDLYVSKLEPETSKLYRNDGGLFADVGAAAGVEGPGNGVGVAWGDYDGDTDLDLHVAVFGGGSKLYRNDGTVFADASAAAGVDEPAWSTGADWWDFDLDGDLDLYAARYVGSNALYRNDGGAFAEIAAEQGVDDPGDGLGVACADYDGDGDLDLFLANAYTPGEDKLFRNDAANGNHWLVASLEGTVSNRSAIGARVRAVTGGSSRIREVSGGSGYLSQGSLAVEFGLGSATIVDTLEIRWPSGVVQVLAGVAADQHVLVPEAMPTGVALEDAVGGAAAALAPAFPNPFRDAVRIPFALPRDARVTLDVFDLQGRRVAALVDERLAAGSHSVAWSGRDAAGRDVASGVYWYRLRAGDLQATRKIVKVR